MDYAAWGLLSLCPDNILLVPRPALSKSICFSMMDYIIVKNSVLYIDLHIIATYGSNKKSIPFCFSLYTIKLVRLFRPG